MGNRLNCRLERLPEDSNSLVTNVYKIQSHPFNRIINFFIWLDSSAKHPWTPHRQRHDDQVVESDSDLSTYGTEDFRVQELSEGRPHNSVHSSNVSPPPQTRCSFKRVMLVCLSTAILLGLHAVNFYDTLMCDNAHDSSNTNIATVLQVSVDIDEFFAWFFLVLIWTQEEVVTLSNLTEGSRDYSLRVSHSKSGSVLQYWHWCLFAALFVLVLVVSYTAWHTFSFSCYPEMAVVVLLGIAIRDLYYFLFYGIYVSMLIDRCGRCVAVRDEINCTITGSSVPFSVDDARKACKFLELNRPFLFESVAVLSTLTSVGTVVISVSAYETHFQDLMAEKGAARITYYAIKAAVPLICNIIATGQLSSLISTHQEIIESTNQACQVLDSSKEDFLTTKKSIYTYILHARAPFGAHHAWTTISLFLQFLCIVALVVALAFL